MAPATRAATPILVIDDDPVICALIREVLQEAGFDVLTAGTANRGLELAEERQPGLILLDLVLPGASGEEVLARLKSDGATAAVPVVVLTNVRASAARLRCLKLGADEFLNKPVPPEELVVRVRTLLGLRETQANLRSEKRRLETLLDGIQEGIVLIDHEENIVLANPIARNFLGLSGDEPLDLAAVREAPNMPKGWIASALSEAEGEGRRQFTVLLDRPVRLSINVDCQPSLDREGNLAGYAIFLRDRTREQRLEDMKSEFISLASHELRTPISALRNAIELLADERPGPLNKTQRELCELALRSIRRLTTLVSDVLDLNRIDANRMNLELESTAIAPLLEAAGQIMRLEAQPRKLTLEVETEPDLPRICADPARMEQILENLLKNAIKFTPPGGKITLRGLRHQDEDGTEWVRIDVADTGIGIKEKFLDRIFDRFFQCESAPSRGKGSGLGLAIVRELVQAHNGRITVESTEGKGTTFHVDLPPDTPGRRREMVLGRATEDARRRMAFLSCILLIDGARSDGMDQLHNALRGVIHRKEDIFIVDYDLGEVTIVLPDTSREEMEVVLQRLISALLPDPRWRTLRVGWATFPEDATDGLRLIAYAREGAQELERILQKTATEV
jgi:signal transduction histidine kinase